MAKKKKSVNVCFADTYVGCGTVANIMGLHEETVRKRAKSGEIPGRLVNGKWTFSHVDLVMARIAPFCGNTVCPVPPTKEARPNVTEVIFVLDRSGSMGGLIEQARRNLQDQLDTLRRSAGPNDVYRITVIAFDNRVIRTLMSQDVTTLKNKDMGTLYPYACGSTALNDAIHEAIDASSLVLDREAAVLISVVTDGGENSSRHKDILALRGKVRDRISTGRFTFAYAGPHGSEPYADGIGIPWGNVTIWEPTVRGTATLGQTTMSSLNTYASARSTGTMSSTSFYAQPVVADPQAFAAKLDDKLVKLDTGAYRVERVMPADRIVIRHFCDDKFGGFQKGKFYYQLTSSEKVQDYKKIVIQDTATGAFYAGWEAAAKLLGIPKFSGTVRIRPGKLGEFKVFVQSTSVNRKLVPGTAVVFLP